MAIHRPSRGMVSHVAHQNQPPKITALTMIAANNGPHLKPLASTDSDGFFIMSMRMLNSVTVRQDKELRPNRSMMWRRNVVFNLGTGYQPSFSNP